MAKGFPEKSEAFWSRGLALINEHHQRRELGAIGQLLLKGEDAAGVLLTIRNRLPDSGRIVVNLSSWYVEPSCRWFAPRMLQMASSAEEELFTDLTPSPEACRLNERLGFHTVTDCTLFYPLPLTALRPAGARLSPLAAMPADTLPDAMRDMLEDHARLGCIVAVMQADGRQHPLVFLKTTTRKLPSARLIYCEDREIAQRHISAIARHLLGQGRLALTMAALEGERNAGGFAAHKSAPIQVKGVWNPRFINETYSELVLLPP
ncbi:hypothetical protein AGRHK599_LOCUS1398 [Rhizobium rhizogenes]|uniref:Uncharacterized protein n=1 Tax=Rhizobium rhizogenes TaxID=359 RepID=A0AAN2A1X6_RHIRH|nr:hypothetical protein [Agrobacterium tumefaciens]MCZ7443169.1 hypothetical protein [Rhizobium rhizogenes]CAD0211469.1 hypothetical protein AGRHK599_LOCUS1398 [Rhizobium rhizogenes]